MNNYRFVGRRLITSAETVLSGKGFFDTAFISLAVLGVDLSVLFIPIQLFLNYDVSTYLSSANPLLTLRRLLHRIARKTFNAIPSTQKTLICIQTQKQQPSTITLTDKKHEISHHPRYSPRNYKTLLNHPRMPKNKHPLLHPPHRTTLQLQHGQSLLPTTRTPRR